jgi:hypothetical protein
MPGDASLVCKSTCLMQSSTENLAGFYRHVLLEDVMPFWLHHGMNATHVGILRFWIGCGKEDGMRNTGARSTFGMSAIVLCRRIGTT